MSDRVIIESGAVLRSMVVRREWRLLDLVTAYGLGTYGLAYGCPYDDDGLAAVALGGLRASGGRRSGMAIAAVDLELRGSALYGNLARYELGDFGATAGYNATTAAKLSADRVAAVAADAAGRTWSGVYPSAKAGTWVRRKAWSDASQRIRYEAGAGTTRAVAVLLSTSVTTARVVRNSEFGVAEWSANDWITYGATGDKQDLSAALFNLYGETRSDGGVAGQGYWMLYRLPAAPIVPPTTTPGTGSSGGIAPPPTGDYVKMARNGVEQWAPVREYTCG